MGPIEKRLTLAGPFTPQSKTLEEHNLKFKPTRKGLLRLQRTRLDSRKPLIESQPLALNLIVMHEAVRPVRAEQRAFDGVDCRLNDDTSMESNSIHI